MKKIALALALCLATFSAQAQIVTTPPGLTSNNAVTAGHAPVFVDRTHVQDSGQVAVTSSAASSHMFATGINAFGVITYAQPAIADVSNWGTGIATALALNVGSAGAPVTFNGAGGTPSSLTLTNATGLPLAGMTNLAASSIIGNNTGSPATPITLNATQIKSLLAIAQADVTGLTNTSIPTFAGLTITSATGNWAAGFTNSNSAQAFIAHGGGFGLFVDNGTLAGSGNYVANFAHNGTSAVYIRGDGNVGIGTTSPGVPLDVVGSIRFRNYTAAGNCLSVDASGNLGTSACAGGAGGSPGGASQDVQFNNGAGGFGGDSTFHYDNTGKRLSLSSGASPSATLDVTGTERFRSMGTGIVNADSNGNLASTGYSAYFDSVCSSTIGKIWNRATGGWGCTSLGYANPVWFDATCDGAGGLCNTGMTAALATSVPVRFVKGSAGTDHYVFNTMSWGTGKRIIADCGVNIDINTGQTVTVTGMFQDPGPCQVFGTGGALPAGGGSIVGLRFNRPEYWGATNAGVAGAHNDQPMLSAASVSAEASSGSDGDRPAVQLACGTGYYLSSTWAINPSVNISEHVQGCGVGLGQSRLIGKTSGFTGNQIFQVNGQTAGGSPDLSIMNFELDHFAVVPETDGDNIRCINIGSASKSISGQINSSVHDIVTQGCITPLRITGNTRLIHFSRIGMWMPATAAGSNGLVLDHEAANEIVGDMQFDTSQVVCNVGHTQTGIYLRSSGLAGASITGVRFGSGFIVYHCDTFVNALADTTGNISDIWFNPGTQIDGTGGVGFALTTDASGAYISDFHVAGTYIQGLTGVAFNVNGGAANSIQRLFMRNNFINSVSARVAYLQDVGAAEFSNNYIGGITLAGGGTNEAIFLLNTNNFVIGGNNWDQTQGHVNVTNILTSSGTTNYLCKFGDRGDNYHSGIYFNNANSAANTACSN